jgi:phage major head subunit gpT-like protein
MLINLANLSLLYTAYHAAFKDGFSRVTPDWNKVSSEIPSSTGSNIYAWLGQFPQLRQWLGDRQIKNMAAHNYTVANLDYEATIGVSRNDIEDDQYGAWSMLFSEMGYAAAVHPDEVMFTLLAAGNATTCYDGQFFFDTDHPVAGSAVANYDATGGGNMWVLMDTRHPLKPLIFQKRKDYNFETFTDERDESVFMRREFVYGVDARVAGAYGLWQQAYASLNTLNATNFDAAVTAMMQFQSDEGRPLGIRPNLLVCGPSNRAAARDLIDLDRLASGAANPNYQEVEVLVSPFMT